MELQHLRTFLTVAQSGSLTRAAESLFLTQPAVSAQVKALEEELGVQLFRRAARGMVLTEAGEELLKAARDVVDRADGVARLAQRLREGVSGTLRLGTIDCGFNFKLARMVGRMTNHHPDVEVQLVASNSGTNIRAILDQMLDVAMVEGEFDAERIRGWRLGTSRLGVIGPAAWRDDLVHSGWQRLSEFPWIFQSDACSYCMLLKRISREKQIEFKPQFHADAFGAVKDLVAEGLALSIADLDESASLVESGEVFVWPHFSHTMPVSLIALQQRADEPLIRAFADIAVGVHQPSVRRQAKPLSA